MSFQLFHTAYHSDIGFDRCRWNSLLIYNVELIYALSGRLRIFRRAAAGASFDFVWPTLCFFAALIELRRRRHMQPVPTSIELGFRGDAPAGPITLNI
jgi:hypothetical protein